MAETTSNTSLVIPIRPDEIESQLRKFGFDQVECHHAKGTWLSMAATKAR